MFRFVQTWNERPSDVVFDIGWLADNNTLPGANWQANNPPMFRSTPRHMPCLQLDYEGDGDKTYLYYFCDLVFKQPENRGPLSMLFLTLLCFKFKNSVANEDLHDVIDAVRTFRTDNADSIPTVIHFGQLSIAKAKSSSPEKKTTIKPGATKTDDKKKDVSETDNAEVQISTTPSSIPPGKRKRKKQSTPTATQIPVTTHQKLYKDEEDWTEIVADMKWTPNDLIPPPLEWEDNMQKTLTRSTFFDNILTFNKKVDFANRLSTKSFERVNVLSKHTDHDLEEIRGTLQKINWALDMDSITNELEKAIADEKKYKRKKMKKKKKRTRKVEA